jgi:hypothetical protein
VILADLPTHPHQQHNYTNQYQSVTNKHKPSKLFLDAKIPFHFDGQTSSGWLKNGSLATSSLFLANAREPQGKMFGRRFNQPHPSTPHFISTNSIPISIFYTNLTPSETRIIIKCSVQYQHHHQKNMQFNSPYKYREGEGPSINNVLLHPLTRIIPIAIYGLYTHPYICKR